MDGLSGLAKLVKAWNEVKRCIVFYFARAAVASGCES
jgi:hypothetical protein